MAKPIPNALDQRYTQSALKREICLKYLPITMVRTDAIVPGLTSVIARMWQDPGFPREGGQDGQGDRSQDSSSLSTSMGRSISII